MLRITAGIVDVRDVASLHLLAMVRPEAGGQRFLATSGSFMTLREIGQVLRSRLGRVASRTPTGGLPNWLVRVFSWFPPIVSGVLPELGKVKNARNDKATRLLGWRPQTPEDAIIATAESLIGLGLVKG